MRSFVLASLLVAFGCSSGGDLDTLCSESDGIVTAYWTAQYECGSPALRNPLFGRAYQAHNCRAYFGPMLDAQAITIDHDAIDRCRTALAATCTADRYKDWFAMARVCDDVTAGTRALGTSCSVDEECTGPTYCKLSGTCGACSPTGADGATCSADNECESGLCAYGTCVARGSGAPGDTCSVDAQCGPDLVCSLQGCATPASRNLKDCAFDAQCGSYQAACVAGQCQSLKVEGQYCSPWSVTNVQSHCRWFEGQGCMDGTCQALPKVGKGQPCGYDIALCEGTLSCVNNACIEIVPESGACTSDDVCGPYASCRDGACTFSELIDACTSPSGG